MNRVANKLAGRLNAGPIRLFLLTQCCLAMLLMVPVATAVAESLSSNEKQQRIISTDAGTTEIIIALGKGESLVGVDVTSSLPETLSPAKVGYHRNLAAEGLLSLAPSMIFGNEHIGPKETVDALKRAQVRLVLQPTATAPQQLVDNIQQVARVLDISGDALIRQVDQAQRSINERLSLRNNSETSNAVFILYLQGRGFKQAGAGTSGDALLQLLGVKNDASYKGYRSISAEGLLAIQPDLVLIASQDPGAVDQLLQQYPVLKHSQAFKNQKMLVVDASTLVSGISIGAMNEAARLAQAL
ncbi:ABC transporter substrate-binding protein [Aestuariirhabdus sp. Z084]|uniref:heme/hemin ABC transporter substrate-binding protein n=1 Tax=Aestuariirhabdus haliotis TaxID=2918751 RepID=UPI00201B3721|nr:ABC transporter substrate-binding protein [Aestuariirhabdus haliotis]MCL6417474.1 ABC transporter substrate-binding protein [Aestuariirhabdus haliotis]MCL6421407.1 ABC transporter substrate-binding protein [Aestuariirhabdus haliotis]